MTYNQLQGKLRLKKMSLILIAIFVLNLGIDLVGNTFVRMALMLSIFPVVLFWYKPIIALYTLILLMPLGGYWTDLA